MTIVEFIRARFNEDEASARAAILPERIDGWANPPLPADSGCWIVRAEVGEVDDPEDWYAIEDEQSGEIVVYNESRPDSNQAAFITRHDPARVLAQVAAMRAIVDSYERAISSDLTTPDECGALYVCVLDLASIWSSHDQYDPSWAPDA